MKYFKEKKVLDILRHQISNHHYLKDDAEMEKLFSDLPEALENNYNFS